ncbi:MAG: tyrosine-type recombinase/integrase [Proteobacteria bacterium]|nr:site-specific integrase [Pseudomonadota bacterium]NOG61184.1 tyrosine-type recombinase/integrase [Pseudomonadota bacterium]
MSKGKVSIRGDSIAVTFYYKGQRFRPTLKGLSASKKAHVKTAEEILIQIQAEIAKNTFNFAKFFPEHPQAKIFRTGSDITIEEKLNTWLERKRRSCAASTYRDYKGIIDHHLITAFGQLSLSELKPAHIRDWIDGLLISNHRINNILIPLKAIFLEAYQDELIESNPTDRIKRLPRKYTEPQPFTTKERDDILNACEGQIRNLFQFAFWTGLRTGELIALKWEDVSLTKKQAFIRNTKNRHGNKDTPKTDAGIRNIELLPPAISALKAQKKFTTEGHIFLNPRTEKPWTDDAPIRKTAWKPALIKAGVKYRKPYNTRHTFASIMLSSNTNPMWVARQLGHKDWGMIRKVYGRWIEDVDVALHDKISFLWTQNGHGG